MSCSVSCSRTLSMMDLDVVRREVELQDVRHRFSTCPDFVAVTSTRPSSNAWGTDFAFVPSRVAVTRSSVSQVWSLHAELRRGRGRGAASGRGRPATEPRRPPGRRAPARGGCAPSSSSHFVRSCCASARSSTSTTGMFCSISAWNSSSVRTTATSPVATSSTLRPT